MRNLLTRLAVRLAASHINAMAHRMALLEHEVDLLADQRDGYLEQLKFSMYSNKRKRAELRLQHELKADSSRIGRRIYGDFLKGATTTTHRGFI